MQNVSIYITHDIPPAKRQDGVYRYDIILNKEDGTESAPLGVVEQVECTTQNGIVLEAITKALGRMAKDKRLSIDIYMDVQYISNSFYVSLDKWSANGFNGSRGEIKDADKWKVLAEYREKHLLKMIYAPTTAYSRWQELEIDRWKKERETND